jgi:uncharacterized protein YdcH (DUF465 family)
MSVNHSQLESMDSIYEELRRQHQEYEKQLEELSNRAWLTPDEEIEEKRIKKLKLRIKDEMARMKRAAS